ncbi:MAG: DUF3149 domain-containing protein [Rhodocyclaceae bacterium]|nr:MAG: DUF3149 domain-containing protein [Rhodocyclaceae bacterium]
MALQILFGSDIGLLSLFTIGFVIAMGGFIYHYVRKHADEDAKKAHQ